MNKNMVVGKCGPGKETGEVGYDIDFKHLLKFH
jgi:hypothetical protein